MQWSLPTSFPWKPWWLSFRNKLEDGCGEGIKNFLKIILKNFTNMNCLCEKKKNIQKIAKNNTYFFWVLHHLTAKFHLKTSSTMHSNWGYSLFQKPKISTKMMILEEENNVTSMISNKSLMCCFCFLPTFSF